MSCGSESTDFEWLEPALVQVSGQVKEHSSQFLKEGYLHVMEKMPKASTSVEGSSQFGRAINLVRRFSDSAMLGSWTRRWCVLSYLPKAEDNVWLEDISECLPAPRLTSLVGGAAASPPKGSPPDSTDNPLISPSGSVELSYRTQLVSDSAGTSGSSAVEGLHLLLYKDESSFSRLQSPCTVVALEHCVKLSSLPAHTKSEYTFSISFTHRDLLFYTDTSSEFEEWLKILQDTLNLRDAYFHSPLKGLPKQKALRKDNSFTAQQQGDTSREKKDTPATPTTSVPPRAEQSLWREGVQVTPKATPGATVQRARSFSLSKKNSPYEEPVRVLNFKKLAT